MRARQHAVRQERRRGQGVGAATRATGHGELVDVQRVGDGDDVRDIVFDDTTGASRRFAVTGAVEGQPAHTVRGRRWSGRTSS